MDRLSVIGLLVGLLAIGGGQILEGGHLGSLSQPTALLIVVGGTLGAVMLQSPYATFVRGARMAKWIWYPPVVDHLQLIQQVSTWSQVSRREGLLALDAVVGEMKDEFTRKGLQLLVDGAEPERLREVMEVEISTFEQEMKLSARVWEAAGGYSPTIGILGAVMG
jgi:chemotaxis protein MotA